MTGRPPFGRVENITSQGELFVYPSDTAVPLHCVDLPLLLRNQSSLLAFTIPKNWKPGAGVSIVGTHIDSPNLRVYLPLSGHSR